MEVKVKSFKLYERGFNGVINLFNFTAASGYALCMLLQRIFENADSITGPVQFGNSLMNTNYMPTWWNGRHDRLKICWAL
jgi:hypothetical protein